MKKIIFILIILSAVSCNPIIMRMAGMRNPRVETKDDILKFIKENSDLAENIYIRKDNYIHKTLPKDDMFSHPIGLDLYDANGYYLSSGNTSGCTGIILRTTDSFMRNYFTERPSLQSSPRADLYKIIDTSFNAISSINLDKSKPTIAFFFCKYYYKYAKQNFLLFNKFKTDFKDKANFIILNTDENETFYEKKLVGRNIKVEMVLEK
ncbi:MAG: hypothetical protein NTX03_08305 [Bacteroidetes bacterium]|nr:hypothetical protein [Bacteroidota bacterium]